MRMHLLANTSQTLRGIIRRVTPLVLIGCHPATIAPADDQTSMSQWAPPPGTTTVPIQLVRDGAVLVPAAVNGHHGIFLLDTGGPAILLNTDYLTVTASGAIDTNVVSRTDTLHPPTGVRHTWEKDSVVVQIGTLTTQVVPRTARAAIQGGPMAVGAGVHFLSVLAGQPVLGILGLPALAPYETIIDYTHHRLTLIPVDSAGKRLVAVPYYTATEAVPMFSDGGDWFVKARMGDHAVDLQLDLGNDRNELNVQMQQRVAGHLHATDRWNVIDGNREPGVVLDQLVLGDRSYGTVPFYISQRQSCLGGEFFWRHVGAVGLNFHARRLLFYRS